MALRAEVVALEKELIHIRRQLHQYPELAYEEHQTSALIESKLRECPTLELCGPYAKTGWVAVLKGKQAGPCIALRADMDALPIPEESPAEYCSKNPGKMHACGHDGHVAMLLIAAKILSTWSDRLKGTVKFLFQPAEEGHFGALRLQEEGRPLTAAVGGVEVDEVYGAHLWNTQAPGTIGVQPGAVMAFSDFFVIKVQGKGGHGSMPHHTIDAVVIAAQLVVALQTIVSRNVSPLDSAVVTVGRLQAGSVRNAIAKDAELEGTLRSYSAEVRDKIFTRIRVICDGIALQYGAEISVEFGGGFQAVVNTEEQSAKVAAAATKVVGPQRCGPPSLSMAGEDFSEFLKTKPGCFFFVGSSPSEQPTQHPHHSPQFDIDESALSVGASVWVQLVDDLLC